MTCRRTSSDSAAEDEGLTLTSLLGSGPDQEPDTWSPHYLSPGISLSSITSVPVLGLLVQKLPGIILRAADSAGLCFPVVSVPPPDESVGQFVAPVRPPDPVWPQFPAVIRYFSGSVAEPLKLKAPVQTYDPITKVDQLTDHGFPPVPPLVSRLWTVFRMTPCGLGRRPVPPSSSDWLLARRTDRSHQCALQSAAVSNNVALLASRVRLKDLDLSPEDQEDLCSAADTIVSLCVGLAVSSARVASWQTLLQRNMWLQTCPHIPEDLKQDLLQGPIGPEGRFGPHLDRCVADHNLSQELQELSQQDLINQPQGRRRVRWGQKRPSGGPSEPDSTQTQRGSRDWLEDTKPRHLK